MPYASKAKRIEYMRKYQLAHKKELNEYRRKWMTGWRAKNPERNAAQTLPWRLANPELVRAYVRKCKKKHSEAYRKADRERAKVSRWLQPEKQIAHLVVGYAMATGQLIRPSKCSSCGKKCKPEAHHHHGYTCASWFDVVWLCKMCHSSAHLPDDGHG